MCFGVILHHAIYGSQTSRGINQNRWITFMPVALKVLVAFRLQINIAHMHTCSSTYVTKHMPCLYDPFLRTMKSEAFGCVFPGANETQIRSTRINISAASPPPTQEWDAL